MRCPKCHKPNYGDVTHCYSCGEPLMGVQQASQHRYGPCLLCGNPQAEYFAAGNGQCRACMRTFTWKQDLSAQTKKPEEDEAAQKKKKTMMVVAVVVAVCVVLAAVGVWWMLAGTGDDDDDDGPVASPYVHFDRVIAYPSTATESTNVTVSVRLTFKEPAQYNSTNTNVELWYRYNTRSTGAVAEDHEEMQNDWLQSLLDALADLFGNETDGSSDAPATVEYSLILGLHDVSGPVTMWVNVYSSKEWVKSEDRREALAVSEEYTDLLTYN